MLGLLSVDVWHHFSMVSITNHHALRVQYIKSVLECFRSTTQVLLG